ncbi:hypothetical protein THIOM_001483 [Candidatus Thiomargarita nelsonii]|uniref:Uncharacterized protein n=1 Tax=Candidatus Thiomargarita nelsonii TaxID=1003181 RepID=A0A176S3L7_9GAMM|nr:hypothetical protein THIOM_001483 [Candidatus Thiomargarita nelsonii]
MMIPMLPNNISAFSISRECKFMLCQPKTIHQWRSMCWGDCCNLSMKNMMNYGCCWIPITAYKVIIAKVLSKPSMRLNKEAFMLP